tara:strand:- start:322 stop:546 length:225 start_codon:yes stop_codon:yes gene_type:complete
MTFDEAVNIVYPSRKQSLKSKKELEETRDMLLEICEINTRVDWNTAEAQTEFKDMHDLIDLVFDKLLKGVNDAN